MRVADSDCHFDCLVAQVIDIPGRVGKAACKLIAEVVGLQMSDDAITEDGRSVSEDCAITHLDIGARK